jgi:hypothetical protein
MTALMRATTLAIGFVVAATRPALCCSPEPWSADPCRRADLPACYYDWISADGERLGTCTGVLNRCEAQFTAILAMCKNDGCSKDLIAFATKNLRMTESAYGTVCSHTGRSD